MAGDTEKRSGRRRLIRHLGFVRRTNSRYDRESKTGLAGRGMTWMGRGGRRGSEPRSRDDRGSGAEGFAGEEHADRVREGLEVLRDVLRRRGHPASEGNGGQRGRVSRCAEFARECSDGTETLAGYVANLPECAELPVQEAGAAVTRSELRGRSDATRSGAAPGRIAATGEGAPGGSNQCDARGLPADAAWSSRRGDDRARFRRSAAAIRTVWSRSGGYLDGAD